MNRIVAISGALALVACNRTSGEQQTAEKALNTAHRVAPPSPETNTARDVAERDERGPLVEPKGPIDPRSAEAAGQVVQHYGALIEQGRWAEAEKLWGNADAAARLASELRRYPNVHLEIGKPGDMEGAAGSVYVTEPVMFYGSSAAGSMFRRPADVILRRVNDVPGSTEAQRRWHIDRIDWKSRT